MAQRGSDVIGGRDGEGASDELPSSEQVGDGVWSICLNRPAKLNALTHASLFRLHTVVEELSDRGARAVVLHGQGRAFCAGGDIGEMQTMSPEQRLEYLEGYRVLSHAIATAPFVVVAALHGAVVGGGLELACMADARVADANAVFCAADIAHGLLPTGGLTWKLPRMIGRGRASWLLVSNSTLGAQRAFDIGLCDAVTGEDESLPTALEWANSMARFPGAAISETKQALAFGDDSRLAGSMGLEVSSNARALGREDVHSRLAVALDRRPPITPNPSEH